MRIVEQGHSPRRSPFGPLLRTYRLAAGLTQAALGERAGVSTRGIQDIERGLTHPCRATADLLIRALQLAGPERRELESAAAPLPRRRRQKPPREKPPLLLAPARDRRRATILSAELSTGPATGGLPSDGPIRILLDRGVTAMAQVVERHGGTLLARTDQGLMAAFGAPRAQESHAGRAAQAALRLGEAIAPIHDTARRGCGIEISVRVSLATGDVELPSDAGLLENWIAQGSVTREAACLLRMTPPGAIRASEATVAEAGAAFSWQAPSAVRGPVSSANATFRDLLWARTVGNRFQDRVALGLTPLVGRRRELRALMDRWSRARTGCGEVVCLVAEAGMGKSRLIYELQRRLCRQGTRTVVGSCFALGDPIPYLPFVQILKSVLGIDDSTPPPQARRQIARTIESTGLAPSDVAAHVEDLLGYGATSEPLTKRPFSISRRGVPGAVARLLIEVARVRGGIAVVVDDLHWIDPASEEIVGALVEATADAPLLLLLAYRPSYVDGRLTGTSSLRASGLSSPGTVAMMRALCRRSSVRTITLDPLAPADAEELLRGALRGHSLSRRLEAAIVERAEGNPLFVEELARTPEPKGGAPPFSLPHDSATRGLAGEIPAIIRDALLERVDMLRPELKALLQLAALTGREVSRSALASVVTPGTDLDTALLGLETLGFIRLTHLAPDRAYRFELGLMREALAQSIVDDARTACEERLARMVDPIEGKAEARSAPGA